LVLTRFQLERYEKRTENKQMLNDWPRFVRKMNEKGRERFFRLKLSNENIGMFLDKIAKQHPLKNAILLK